MALSENEKQSLNTLIDTALAGWTEEQWCQHAWSDGDKVCAFERLIRSNSQLPQIDLTMLSQKSLERWGCTVSHYNDTHSFAQVREMLLSLKE